MTVIERKLKHIIARLECFLSVLMVGLMQMTSHLKVPAQRSAGTKTCLWWMGAGSMNNNFSVNAPLTFMQNDKAVRLQGPRTTLVGITLVPCHFEY